MKKSIYIAMESRRLENGGSGGAGGMGVDCGGVLWFLYVREVGKRKLKAVQEKQIKIPASD